MHYSGEIRLSNPELVNQLYQALPNVQHRSLSLTLHEYTNDDENDDDGSDDDAAAAAVDPETKEINKASKLSYQQLCQQRACDILSRSSSSLHHLTLDTNVCISIFSIHSRMRKFIIALCMLGYMHV
jgi:hypothetical protein